MISGIQFRMARAALGVSTRDLGNLIGKSGMAVSRYERGDESVFSVATMRSVEAFFKDKGIIFTDRNGVCIDETHHFWKEQI